MARRCLLILLCLLLAPCAKGAEEVDPAKRVQIERLLNLSGVAAVRRQLTSSLLDAGLQALRSNQPDLPDRAREVMKAELEASLEEFFAPGGPMSRQQILSYDAAFTLQELRDLNAFYESALGRKVITVMPRLVGEATGAVQQWLQTAGPGIERRLFEALAREGLLKPKSQ